MTPEKIAAANNVSVTGLPAAPRSVFGIPTGPWKQPSLSVRQAAVNGFRAACYGHPTDMIDAAQGLRRMALGLAGSDLASQHQGAIAKAVQAGLFDSTGMRASRAIAVACARACNDNSSRFAALGGLNRILGDGIARNQAQAEFLGKILNPPLPIPTCDFSPLDSANFATAPSARDLDDYDPFADADNAPPIFAEPDSFLEGLGQSAHEAEIAEMKVETQALKIERRALYNCLDGITSKQAQLLTGLQDLGATVATRAQAQQQQVDPLTIEQMQGIIDQETTRLYAACFSKD